MHRTVGQFACILYFSQKENSIKKIDVYRFSLQQKNHFCEKENSMPKTNMLKHFFTP